MAGMPLHDNPDDHTADDVDQGDDDTGDRIPFDELHRTVHRTIELALFLDRQAFFARLVGIQDPCAHVGVDTHLLTRHGVQGKAGGNLSDPLSTLGDHDELHQGNDQEDNTADDEVSSDDEVTELEDDFPGICVEEICGSRRCLSPGDKEW